MAARRCYACDATAAGSCDRRRFAEGCRVPACERHRDSAKVAPEFCTYCGDPTRKGSIDIDGSPAHARCHEQASNEGL